MLFADHYCASRRTSKTTAGTFAFPVVLGHLAKSVVFVFSRSARLADNVA